MAYLWCSRIVSKSVPLREHVEWVCARSFVLSWPNHPVERVSNDERAHTGELHKVCSPGIGVCFAHVARCCTTSSELQTARRRQHGGACVKHNHQQPVTLRCRSTLRTTTWMRSSCNSGGSSRNTTALADGRQRPPTTANHNNSVGHRDGASASRGSRRRAHDARQALRVGQQTIDQQRQPPRDGRGADVARKPLHDSTQHTTSRATTTALADGQQ